jgi:hypothetical protein
MTIVIERGVLKPDIRVARFDFIYQKFQENQWSSMLNDGGKIYPRLLWEFYKNLVITNLREQSPSFETKVRSVKIHIDTSLISLVTGIPISTDLGFHSLKLLLNLPEMSSWHVLISERSLFGMKKARTMFPLAGLILHRGSSPELCCKISGPLLVTVMYLLTELA